MNKEDLRVYRAWHFCESVLGPTLTNELKRGRSIYIAAKNGEVYELGPRGNVGSVTRNCTFCIQIESMFGDSSYPFPDLIVHRFDWIKHNPDYFNKVAVEESPKLNSRMGRNLILTGSRFAPPRRININRLRYAIEHEFPLEREDVENAILWGQYTGENLGRRVANRIGNIFHQNPRREAICQERQN